MSSASSTEPSSLSSSWADVPRPPFIRSASPSPSTHPSLDGTHSQAASTNDSSDDDDDADEEWRESMRQLELFGSLVLFPLAGKWLGRRTAYWVWKKVMMWKYPAVEVVVTSRKVFEGLGLLEAAGSGIKKAIVG